MKKPAITIAQISRGIEDRGIEDSGAGVGALARSGGVLIASPSLPRRTPLPRPTLRASARLAPRAARAVGTVEEAAHGSALPMRSIMRIAVPAEVLNHEYRVALTPNAARELVRRGHEVGVQSGAGAGSGFLDDDYAAAGASILPEADSTWAWGELVVKVKQPIKQEYGRLRRDQVLFTFLHLAAERACTDALLDAGTTAIAYETVQLDSGRLPLLYPMSEVAGCLAPQVGAYYLTAHAEGRGVLLGGIGGVANAKVLVLGAGVAGQNAVNIARGMGADVTIMDNDLEKLRAAYWRWGGAVRQIFSTDTTVREEIVDADLVIGTVLVTGAKAPTLVTSDMVETMKPGSVLVDLAVDQGGCFADSKPTTHGHPTFEAHDCTFYCVTNMPGAVPHTSTTALANATLPYIEKLADLGWRDAMREDPALARGLNTHMGDVTYPGVAQAFDLPSRSVADVIG